MVSTQSHGFMYEVIFQHSSVSCEVLSLHSSQELVEFMISTINCLFPLFLFSNQSFLCTQAVGVKHLTSMCWQTIPMKVCALNKAECEGEHLFFFSFSFFSPFPLKKYKNELVCNQLVFVLATWEATERCAVLNSTSHQQKC